MKYTIDGQRVMAEREQLVCCRMAAGCVTTCAAFELTIIDRVVKKYIRPDKPDELVEEKSEERYALLHCCKRRIKIEEGPKNEIVR